MDFGAAGRHLHDIFYNGFGTKVIVSDQYASDSVKSIYPNVKFVSFEILLERSDIIFIHVPLSPETNHLFNKEAFRKMKNTAMVINTACIPIINQKDLVWALQEGEILYAGLDTVEKKPITPNNPLLKMDNVILSPHIGFYGIGSKKTQICMVCNLSQTVVTSGSFQARCVATPFVLDKFPELKQI